MALFNKKTNQTNIVESQALLLSEVFGGELDGPAALKNDVVLAIVNLVANTCASFPIKVLSEDKKGNLYNFKTADEAILLSERPNSYQDPYTFKYNLFFNAFVWGQAFIFKVRSGNKLVELRPISPDRVTVRWQGGLKFYDISSSTDSDRIVGRFTNNEIIHFLDYTEDGINAKSRLQKIHQLIQADNTLKRFTKKYFANGASPSMYAKVAGTDNEDDLKRAAQGFAKDFAQVDNAGKIPFVTDNVTLVQLQVTAKDAMMVESLKYYVEAICRGLGVPPSQVFSKDGASYNSMEMDNIQFYRSCIGPLITKFESALDYGLFLGQKHYVKFDTENLMRTTTIEKYNAYRLALGGNAWKTVNEVRAMDDQNPVEGGDVIMKMVNTQDITTPANKGAPQ